jgi:hypothetical protein
MQNRNCRPLALSLSLVVQTWARENTVAVSAFHAPPHPFTIQSSKTSMTLGFITVGGNWFFFVFSWQDFAIFWPQIFK